MRSPLLLLVTTTCILLAGCVPNHPVRYYTLEPRGPVVNQGNPDGPTILVAAPSASESLQDERILYRSGPYEVGAYEYHHWMERPAIMVRDELINALRSSGKYKRVLLASSVAAGDYLVRGHLREFEEVDNPAIQTSISLHLQLIDGKTNRVVWDHRFNRDEPASGKSMNDVVASMDRNLHAVASEATAIIDQFVSERH